jgi:hypothetical protein
MNPKKIFIGGLLAGSLLLPPVSVADTILFKNGTTFEIEKGKYVIEGDTLKIKKYGGILEYPKDEIQKIIETNYKNPDLENTEPAPPTGINTIPTRINEHPSVYNTHIISSSYDDTAKSREYYDKKFKEQEKERQRQQYQRQVESFEVQKISIKSQIKTSREKAVMECHYDSRGRRCADAEFKIKELESLLKETDSKADYYESLKNSVQ